MPPKENRKKTRVESEKSKVDVDTKKEQEKTEAQQRRAYNKQERARIAVEKRKKVIAKRFKPLPIFGSQARLEELLKKEQTCNLHVKNFPHDLDAKREHKEIIKQRGDLEVLVPPYLSRVTNTSRGTCHWLVKSGRNFEVEEGVEYYEINLRLCRITKLRWFPHHGQYPGIDGNDQGKRWYCIKLDASVNQLSNLEPGKLELFHELRRLDLQSNQIIKIGDGLRGLEYLRHLDISNNYIEKLMA